MPLVPVLGAAPPPPDAAPVVTPPGGGTPLVALAGVFTGTVGETAGTPAPAVVVFAPVGSCPAAAGGTAPGRGAVGAVVVLEPVGNGPPAGAAAATTAGEAAIGGVGEGDTEPDVGLGLGLGLKPEVPGLGLAFVAGLGAGLCCSVNAGEMSGARSL